MRAKRVYLAGNPNVGKSTIFNALTGLRQHTGNWPGKTVALAEGTYRYMGQEYCLTDLPGTYSLSARSQEEQVAAKAISSKDYDCVAIVCDGTCLERNLILVYQILQKVSRVVVVVNLMDEAQRRGIFVDCRKLSANLGVPVVSASAGQKRGLEELQWEIRMICEDYTRPHPCAVPEERRARIRLAEETAKEVVTVRKSGKDWQLFWDRLLTGRKTGIPCMILLFFLILWLTIFGANAPSDWLWNGVFRLYGWMQSAMAYLNAPWWLTGALLDGMLLTAGRVIAVMLPPMAIFFPLFTLLEDLGYLPRVAYNLDHSLERCGGCGKLGLTMCMGLGCNAVGVTGCRIIDSPRERTLGVLTNSFMPCNGRFGALILLLSAFLLPGGGSAAAAIGLTGFLVLAVGMTMLVSKFLSSTVLKGMPSSFVLELPHFRKPRVGQVVVRSLLDRTMFVLGRAASVALPAGLVLWLFSTATIGGHSLIVTAAQWLEPVGRRMGLSGPILLAFLLGFPANEIVLPIILLIVSGSFGLETDSAALATGLSAAGFTVETALCTAIFFLFHWPCATTCLTIYKETGSKKWTTFAIVLPTVIGAVFCMGVHAVFLLL